MNDAALKPVTIPRETALSLLRDMVRIRRFEERCADLYGQQKIRGFLHLYIGEEAVAVGAIHALAADDAIVATYREHGHALARGVPANVIMAEMYGKREGCCRGRGGSMHLFDASTRLYGGNAIVGGGLPLAVGLALADRMQRRSRVTAVFFGEGAVAEGVFHESLNLAALWQLPVAFFCENNFYAMGTALARSESQTDLCVKAAAFRVPATKVDGMDVVAVHEAARKAVDTVRGGGGPVFVEFETYRYRAHSMFDPDLYRDKAEIESWKQRGPIHNLTNRMKAEGSLTEDAFLALDAEAIREVDAAAAFAEAGTWEPVEDLARDLCTENARMRITYREALRAAMHDALASDPRVFLMGEDVGKYGGSYAVSKGFLDEFGPERIRDTPLSELAFVGAGIGAALGGMRPIVEVMTVNFSLLALDQIVNTAALYRHMSGGQLSLPLVIRMATGAGRQLAAQHSHSLENWYAHVPGLTVLAPATVDDARGMLAPALADPDPVVIFEHAFLYNTDGELTEAWRSADLRSAKVLRAGTDVTLVAWGGTVWKALAAAEELAASGVEAEVIDLRVLRPLDDATVMNSVRRTHRAVIVDEGWRSGSLAAEVSARIMEQALYDLDAPVARICSEEVPMPYAKHLEEAALPQPSKIVAAVRQQAGHA